MSVETRIEQRRLRESGFIEHLRHLDAGDLARLRRHAGRTLAESTGVLGLFYRLLPYGVPERQHEHYFLVATLFPLTSASQERDFGATLSRMRGDHNRAGLDRRVEALLDADEAQLRFRLRQMVRLTHANRVGVNWEPLLHDVLDWTRVDRRVQKRWAMSYFRVDQPDHDDTPEPDTIEDQQPEPDE